MLYIISDSVNQKEIEVQILDNKIKKGTFKFDKAYGYPYALIEGEKFFFNSMLPL